MRLKTAPKRPQKSVFSASEACICSKWRLLRKRSIVPARLESKPPLGHNGMLVTHWDPWDRSAYIYVYEKNGYAYRVRPFFLRFSIPRSVSESPESHDSELVRHFYVVGKIGFIVGRGAKVVLFPIWPTLVWPKSKIGRFFIKKFEFAHIDNNNLYFILHLVSKNFGFFEICDFFGEKFKFLFAVPVNETHVNDRIVFPCVWGRRIRIFRSEFTVK